MKSTNLPPATFLVCSHFNFSPGRWIFHSKNSPDINSETPGCQKIGTEINPHRVSLFLFPFKKKSTYFQSGFQFQINVLMTSCFIPSYTNSNEFYFFKYYLVNVHQFFLGYRILTESID